MLDDGVGAAPHRAGVAQQPELEVGVLAPFALEAFVETADREQRAAPDKGVGRGETGAALAPRIVAGAALDVALGARPHHFAAQRDQARNQRAFAVGEPVRGRNGVVSCEGDDLPVGRPPAGVARDPGAPAVTRSHQPHHRRIGTRPEGVDHRLGVARMPLVDDDDLIGRAVQALRHDRGQASTQEIRAPERRDDDRNPQPVRNRARDRTPGRMKRAGEAFGRPYEWNHTNGIMRVAGRDDGRRGPRLAASRRMHRRTALEAR